MPDSTADSTMAKHVGREKGDLALGHRIHTGADDPIVDRNRVTRKP